METHSDIVGELLDRGIHVFVEKPLAQTAAEVRALTQRADRRKVLLCPAHQYAFQAGLRRAVAELPHVGSLRRVDFDICSAGAVGPFAGRPIDVIGEILPHPLSILQAVAPRCDLGKLDWSVRSGEGGRELLASTRVETALVSLFISLAARPTSFRTRLQGERATFEVDGFQGGAIRLPARSTRVAKLLAAYERAGRLAIGASATLAARVVRGETAYPGLRSLVKRFYAAVDGAPAPVTTPHMVEAAAARDNLLRELRGATGASAR